MTAQVASHHNFHAERPAFITDGRICSGCVQEPVRAYILSGTKHECRQLIQYLSFIRNGTRQYDVKSGDAIGGDHHQQFIINAVNVSNLTAVKTGLIWEVE